MNQLLSKLEDIGYKVYSDSYGGIMVKANGVPNLYSNANEYKGETAEERRYNQIMAIYKELGVKYD